MKYLMCALMVAAAMGVAAPGLAAKRPRLVVQITFDQLRGDLLERYRPAFSGGFKRVLDQGWWVKRGEAAHGITVSWPGHATLATGLFPSHHGLTANEWWEQVGADWRSVNLTRDPSTRIVGREGEVGESPWRMEGTSIGDWFKAASPASKVVAIGSDAVIPYAGRKPDGAYWFDPAAGGFTTSTYYAATRPAWIAALNRRIASLPQTWSMDAPARWHALTNHPNRCPSMQPIAAFPHRYQASAGSYLSWVGSTPLADEELLSQVGDIVRAEGLGQDEVPDYLNIAAGSTDSVGHEYGPVSLEQLDTMLRLDRALATMFDDLDRTVGKGRYVVAISADHGVVDPPEENCIHRVTGAEIDALLDRVEAIAKAHAGDEAALRAMIVAELRQAPFIGDVYTDADLNSAAPGDWKTELMKRSFRAGHTSDFPLWSEKPRPHHPARYGIAVQFKEGVIFHYARAVHGSPYAYDRLVPVIFYGAGVPRRTLDSGARTVDVAPTLAALAALPAPANLDGRPLLAKSSDSDSSHPSKEE